MHLASFCFASAAYGDFGKTTLGCSLGNRCTDDQRSNGLLLFAAEFFAVSTHLRSPAVIG